jgi:hypothetical protein
MTPKLSTELRAALQEQQGLPLTVEDEVTHLHYVLLPLALFQRMQTPLSRTEIDVNSAASEQSIVAGIAGWNDPAMDVYDQYDVHHKQT